MKGGYAKNEIQLLSHDHPTKTICQICAIDLTSKSVTDRQSHYEDHFAHAPEASGSSHHAPTASKATDNTNAAYSKPISKSRKPPSFGFIPTVPIEKQNIFWHPSLASEPPPNFSPGLIPVLKKALTKSHEKGLTQKAWLASEHSVHVNAEQWDRKWGCGYRNYLMVCAALMSQQLQPMYFPLLDTPTSPGIRNLQEVLEEAWRNGFDEEGAEQLDHNLLGTRKWIGTADLYVAFAYRGIPANLADFNDLRQGVEPLVQWIYNYFAVGESQPKGATVGEALRGARSVVVTDKPPIILQHDGHSRTVVGCERVKNGSINLLIFDPSRKVPENIRVAGLHHHNPGGANQTISTSSKVLHKMMHPVETIKSKKRKSTEPEPKHAAPKRKRPSNQGAKDENDVIVIDSDSEDDANPPSGPSKSERHDDPDFGTVLNAFRVSAKQLKKNKYQILYFPLSDPLTEQEKLRRRVVTSERIA
ncbi:peptidase family C78-domain-containing protein [Lenzites betulinus]|nr:peptidase family C78-domain-containing protein [Lenzites betulinus]